MTVAPTDVATAGLTTLYGEMTSLDRVLRALSADGVDVKQGSPAMSQRMKTLVAALLVLGATAALASTASADVPIRNFGLVPA